MFVRPAPGRLVRHPATKEFLPEAGMDVDDNDLYFVRRLRDGDVVKGDGSTAAAAEPAAQPVAKSAKALRPAAEPNEDHQ